jgi:hypothetical protein
METITATRQEPNEILQSYEIADIGTRAGQGHLTQALAVKPGSGYDLMDILYRYSTNEDEARAALRLNFLNDVLPTRIVAGKLNSLGIQVMNTFMDPIYSLGGNVAEAAKTGKYPWNITYHAERLLAETFSRFVTETEPDALVFTLTSGARIANVAKAKGLIKAELPVFNIVLDALGPELVHGIYDPRTEYGIDPYTVNLIGDERTRKIFLSRGYPESQLIMVDPFYTRTLEEETGVIAKMRDFEHFKQFGPDPGHQLQLAIVHDNFETKFENSVTLSLYEDYAAEAEAGKIFFYMTVDRSLMRKFGNSGQFAIVQNAAELAELMTNPEKRSGFSGALIMKPGITNDMYKHANYSEMQYLLALHSHITVSRPSEHPRTAARFNSPTLLTIPFATQEVYMAKLYHQAGFAGHWMQLSRGRLAAIRRQQSRLPRLDLLNPASYKQLEKMAYAGGSSNQHSSVQDIQSVIARVLQNL